MSEDSFDEGIPGVGGTKIRMPKGSIRGLHRFPRIRAFQEICHILAWPGRSRIYCIYARKHNSGRTRPIGADTWYVRGRRWSNESTKCLHTSGVTPRGLIIFLAEQNWVNWSRYSLISARDRGTRLRASSASRQSRTQASMVPGPVGRQASMYLSRGWR